MNFLIDSPETEHQFREVLGRIRSMKNGTVSESMEKRGIHYKFNWGVPVVSLREIAKTFPHGHVLAMKLWNKKWRESMILATMMDVPAEVTEEQMDFWTKSFENIEIAEHAVSNLWIRTPFAFVKALEWCRGKKHFVRFTGIHLAGRLAITDKKAPDEMFDMFFSEFRTLAKDPRLSGVLLRSLIFIARRSRGLCQMVAGFAAELSSIDFPPAKNLGSELIENLKEL